VGALRDTVRSIFRFLALVALGFSGLSQDAFGFPPPVRMISSSDSTSWPNDPVREYFTSTGFRPVSFERLPELAPLAPRLESLLRTLLKPQDGSEPIHLVIEDTMSVNASFVRLSNGERVISVTLGLLHFVDTDDELAFMLGHELRHGTSTLQQRVRELTANQRSVGRTAAAFLLSRTEENEADLRSILEGMIDAGFNPYAVRRLFSRLRDRYGNGIANTHTSITSRLQVIDVVLAGVRSLGRMALYGESASAFRRDITQGLRSSVFESEAFRRYVRQNVDNRIDELGRETLGHYERQYREVLDGNSPQMNLSRYIHNLTSELSTLTEGVWSAREVLEANFWLTLRIHQEAEAARARILPSGFEPRTAAQLRSLLEVDRRDAGQFSPSFLRQIESDLQSSRRAITSYQDAASRESQGLSAGERQITIDRNQARLVELNAAYTDLLSFYTGPGQGSGRTERTVRQNRTHTTDQFRWSLQQLRSLGPAVDQANRRSEALERDLRIRLVLAGLDHRDQRAESLSTFNDIDFPREVRGRYFLEVMQKLIRAAATERPSSPHELVLNWADSGESFTFERFLREYSEHNPQEAANGLTDLYLTMSQTIGRPLSVSLVQERDSNSIGHSGGRGAIEFNLTRQMARRMCVNSAFAIAAIEGTIRDGEHYHQILSSIRELLPRANLSENVLFEPRFRTHPIQIAWRQLLQESFQRGTHREYLHENFSPIGTQLQSLVLVNYPDFRRLAPQEFRLSNEQILADLEQLARLPDRYERPQVSFENIIPLLRNDNVRFAQAYQLRALGYFNRVDELTREGRRFFDQFKTWVQRNHPEDLETLFSFRVQQGVSYRNLVLERWRGHLSSAQGPGRYRSAYEAFLLDARRLGAMGGLRRAILSDSEDQAQLEWLPQSPTERVEAYLQITSLSGLEPDVLQFFESIRVVRGLGDFTALRGVPTRRLAELLVQQLRVRSSLVSNSQNAYLELDHFFSYVWGRIRTAPEGPEREGLLSLLRTPELVQGLFYEENKRTLAGWQLEDRFHLSQRQPPASAQGIRPQLQEIRDFLDAQFPRPTHLKTDFIVHIEHQQVTNQAETEFLDQRKPTEANIASVRELYAVDLPEQINQRIVNQAERIDFLEYLIGLRGQAPLMRRTIERNGFSITVRTGSGPRQVSEVQIADAMHAARRSFAGATLEIRTYALQSLLDGREGIGRTREGAARLLDFILGQHATDPVLRALLESYLRALPEGDRTPFLARMLAVFADQDLSQNQSGRTVNVRAVLEAMGPLGVRAAQAIYTAGLGSAAMRADLEQTLNRANRPDRGHVFERLRRIFGTQIEPIEFLGEIVGSGSVNYVVKARMRDPVNGEVRVVAVRILRETAEQQVINEDQILQRAIAGMRSEYSDRRVQQLASTLDQIRIQSTAMLRPGGPELDPSTEVRNYPNASTVYRSEVAPDTGYRVRLVRPDPHFQAQVLTLGMQNQVAVYEFIEGTTLTAIADPQLRAGLARQMLQTELNALLGEGRFDSDGHPGNYLIDQTNREIVRIDFSQYQQLAPEQRNIIRSLLQALFMPAISEQQIDLLDRILEDVFEFSNSLPNRRAEIARIVRSRDFPPYSSPHERLFALREKLEERLGALGHSRAEVSIRPVIRSAIASLSKIVVYREHMPLTQFAETMLHHIGISQTDFSRSLAASAPRRLLDLWLERLRVLRTSMAQRLRPQMPQLASAAESGSGTSASGAPITGLGCRLREIYQRLIRRR
jgi:hypothetical protein